MSSTPGTQLGRPPKFTDEVKQQLIRFVADGNYLDVACKAVGISPRTLRHWRQMHRDGDPSMVEHGEFFAALEKAMALAEAVSIGDIRSGRMGWQGQAWFLERRYPNRWAKKDKAVAPTPSTTTTYEVEYVDPEPPEDPAPEAP